jgi:hypothetical protein
LASYVWHITYRCHRKSFLLKFARDGESYLRWVDDALTRERMARDARPSEAIAVRNVSFVEKLKSELGFKAAHREVIERSSSNPKPVLSQVEGSKIENPKSIE